MRSLLGYFFNFVHKHEVPRLPMKFRGYQYGSTVPLRFHVRNFAVNEFAEKLLKPNMITRVIARDHVITRSRDVKIYAKSFLIHAQIKDTRAT